MAGSPIRRERRRVALELLAQPDTLEVILEVIANGGSVMSWCKAHEVPYQVAHKWLTTDEERNRQYVEAKQARAQGQLEQIERTVRKVERGKMRPDVGKMVVDSRKWMAAVHDRAQFGDQVRVDGKVEHVHMAHLEALRELVNGKRVENSPPALAHVRDLLAEDDEAIEAEIVQPIDTTGIVAEDDYSDL